ncbi:DUF1343 domain-containing protein [Bacteriovoracaceae bacterium]|nr:DUF1343 domain-containing protein [Bacteriovoracaceae bacterium]
MTLTGLEVLSQNTEKQKLLLGNVAYLCHSASVDQNFKIGVLVLKDILGARLKKIWGPQHGFVTDVQDNMVESSNFHHPYFDLPIESLYGETRVPSEKMMEGIDTIVVDLQDVGTRVYTYITTLSYVLDQAAKLGKRVIVLDRPNPVGGEMIEGNILEPEWKSFVGHLPIPMRHAMTMGEVGHFHLKHFDLECDYHVIQMENWKRSMSWDETGLPWVNPSPNLSTPNSALSFCGTVLFEGTNISEGRGTTRALEVIGAPKIDAYEWCDHLNQKVKEWKLEGFVLRPLQFYPMFQKHSGENCGGVHIHCTDHHKFESWKLGQLLLQESYHQKYFDFKWNDQPYEYQYENLAIDYINGTTKLREWVEKKGSLGELNAICSDSLDDFVKNRGSILLY